MRDRTSIPRFFVSGTLEEGRELALDDSDGHKVRNVLRLEPGAEIELRDSGADAFTARILAVRPDVVVCIEEKHAQAAEGELEITLAQCLPKGGKMDYVVEKAAELGVVAIVPVQSERVIGARDGTGKLDRWRRLARSAAQQSGAVRIPEIREIVDWNTLLDESAAYDRVVIPWELADAPARALDDLLVDAKRVMIAIGPEGGLSHDEVERARTRGAVTISLGRRILRTETAGLIAIAFARYAVGEVS